MKNGVKEKKERGMVRVIILITMISLKSEMELSIILIMLNVLNLKKFEKTENDMVVYYTCSTHLIKNIIRKSKGIQILLCLYFLFLFS